MASIQTALALDVKRLAARQDSGVQESETSTNDNTARNDWIVTGYQVYQFFNQPVLAGFSPAPLNNSTEKGSLDNLGTYTPGKLQAALQSCIDGYADHTQFCITRFAHTIDLAPDTVLSDEKAAAYRGSSAILCCRDGYSVYLTNDRTWNHPAHDVRINCWDAARIANETLTALIEPEKMRLQFSNSTTPLTDGGNSTDTTNLIARSYWSDDVSWGVSIYHRSDKTCLTDDHYNWVGRGKWADLDNPPANKP
ncbi:hypothetical protein TWF730_001847 [Orbilia blumenaviensis]|uniref:Uncharacterized protein n=1 Tax=Orbilia blumenaviensis TaxID=1796055 RepID=A0AAV9UCX8_9PEZI